MAHNNNLYFYKVNQSDRLIITNMAGFLFSDVIFGPVNSRRLGVSLGINLLPKDYKFCTFNCIYCECGWTRPGNEGKTRLPSTEEIRGKLETKLQEISEQGIIPDAITFAGNGEPTLHPQFPEIVDIVIALRDGYFPDTKITVLSNASQVHKEPIFKALRKIDHRIMKLDAGTEETFRTINQPGGNLSLNDIVEYLKRFNGNLIIQTLFLDGELEGRKVGNTGAENVSSWISHLKEINPEYVMIYPIDRETPAGNIRKLSFNELNAIAEKVEQAGFRTKVFG